MLSEQTFIIRPSDLALEKLSRAGVPADDELRKPKIWTQSFDLRITVSSEGRRFCVDSVAIRHVALVLSELDRLGSDDVGNPQGWIDLWDVEFIDAAPIYAEEVEGDYEIEVLNRLVNESRRRGADVEDDFRDLLERLSAV